MAERNTGRITEGLADMLKARGGPTSRQLDYWVRAGHLHPTITPGPHGRDTWAWPNAERRVAVNMARVVSAGVRPPAAELLARHPTGGPLILGPGVIISLFDHAAAVGAELDHATATGPASLAGLRQRLIGAGVPVAVADLAVPEVAAWLRVEATEHWAAATGDESKDRHTSRALTDLADSLTEEAGHG